jgi:hypothetical protein
MNSVQIRIRNFLGLPDPDPLLFVWIKLRSGSRSFKLPKKCRKNVNDMLVLCHWKGRIPTQIWNSIRIRSKYNYLCTYDLYSPCIMMFWMRANLLQGQVGGDWALEFESFLGPVKWHRSEQIGSPRGRFQGPYWGGWRSRCIKVPVRPARATPPHYKTY